MKKILLLFTQYSVDTAQSHPADLCDALAQAAHGEVQYEYALYDDLQYYVASDDARINLPDGRPLETFDLVYQRRWSTMPPHAVSVAIYLQQKGVPFIDAESKHDGSTNKLVQYWRMWEHGLPLPRSVYVSPGRLVAWLEANLAEEFALPCIMKSVASQRGQNNHLVETVAEAVRIAKDNPAVPYIIQEFIPNDGDYRVIVCGDRIGMVIRRTGGESHTNNTSQGAAAEIVPVSELAADVQAACITAAQAFGRDIAGVDVVLHKDDPSKFYFFEVNRSPQIDHSSFTPEKAAIINEYLAGLAGGK